MARVSIRPSAVATHPTEPSLLLITYDVVAVGEGGAEVRLATGQEAPLHVEPAMREEFDGLFGRLGARMEVAVGLADGEATPETKDDGETEADDDREL